MRTPVIFLIISLLWISDLSSVPPTEPNFPKKKEKPPRNIILMIGDGMGVAQVYAGYTARLEQLNMAQFPVSGLVKTNSNDNYVTDSGAGGTAFSTGFKTNNGYIAIGPNGDTLETILQKAEKKGLATGLVATSAITHATPASFIAHCVNRGDYEVIALDFLKTDIDLFIGGGYAHFSKRSDSLNLIDSLLSKGYFVARDLRDVDVPTVSKLAALLADGHLPRVSAGRGEMLSDASAMAVKLLKRNKKGFFLMIEGSQIDWGGHDNNLDYVIEETVDFDNAVGKILEFARKDKETLVLVTADHETGGLGLTGGDLKTGKVEAGFIHKEHTGMFVPIFAYGPGAHYFTGIMDNTDVNKRCLKLLNLK